MCSRMRCFIRPIGSDLLIGYGAKWGQRPFGFVYLSVIADSYDLSPDILEFLPISRFRRQSFALCLAGEREHLFQIFDLLLFQVWITGQAFEDLWVLFGDVREEQLH